MRPAYSSFLSHLSHTDNRAPRLVVIEPVSRRSRLSYFAAYSLVWNVMCSRRGCCAILPRQPHSSTPLPAQTRARRPTAHGHRLDLHERREVKTVGQTQWRNMAAAHPPRPKQLRRTRQRGHPAFPRSSRSMQRPRSRPLQKHGEPHPCSRRRRPFGCRASLARDARQEIGFGLPAWQHAGSSGTGECCPSLQSQAQLHEGDTGGPACLGPVEEPLSFLTCAFPIPFEQES